MVEKPRRIAFLIDPEPDHFRLIRAVRRALPGERKWVTHRADVNEAGAEVVVGWRPHAVVTTGAGRALLRRAGWGDRPILMVSGRRRWAPAVGIDERAVMRAAVSHLRERGFGRLAYFGVYFDGKYRRQPAAFRAVAGRGPNVVHFQPNWIDKDWREIDAEMGRWLRRIPKPIGVVCESDARARQLAEACLQFSINVPDDLAILGLGNDVDLCETVHPPLSSIELPWDRMGRILADWIADAVISRPVEKQAIRLPPVGVVTRASTDTIALEDREVAAAVRYIREHADEGIDVPTVVEATGLGRRAMEQRFKKAMGRTMLQEIRRVRLDQAARLLAETDWSIERVATSTGFASGGSFGIIFKRERGTTPRDHRKAARAEGKPARGT